MIDIVVIGHVMKENIFLNTGEKIGPVLGSPAAYYSVAAALLGSATGLSTVIGKDCPYYIIEPILHSGVNFEGIKIVSKKTTSTKLFYNKDGNKKLIFEEKSQKIIFNYIPRNYHSASAFIVAPIDFDVNLNTVLKLKKLDKLMMIDLGGLGGTVSTAHPVHNKKVEENISNIVSNFNIVKASIEDCLYLFNIKNDRERIIKKLHLLGAEIAILTLGSEGSLISQSGELTYVPVLNEKIKRDTTGAGDVYGAAFLSEYLRTKNLYKSGLFASAASTILIEKTGGVSIKRMPTEKMVRQRIKFARRNSGKNQNI